MTRYRLDGRGSYTLDELLVRALRGRLRSGDRVAARGVGSPVGEPLGEPVGSPVGEPLPAWARGRS